MRAVSLVFVGAAALVMTSGVQIEAHHAFAAQFDANRPMKLEGKVTKVEWTSPHMWIYIETLKPDGTTEVWGVEGANPNVLLRRGFNRDSLAVGSQLKVTGFQAKNGTTRMSGGNVTFSDGRQLFLGSQGTGAPDEKPEKH
jgi:hypothetical protein